MREARRGGARATVAMIVVVVMGGLAVGGLAACAPAGTPPARTLVVGAEDTPAMGVLARIYAIVLRNSGATVSTEVVTGDYPALLDAMDAQRLDLFPARSGALLADLAPQRTPIGSEDVYDELNRSLPQGVSVGDPTTVTAAPQVFVASTTAERAGATDLASCGKLPIGLPLVVATAPDPRVIGSFTSAGCRFGAIEVVGSPAAVIGRVARGDAVGVLSPLDVSGDNAAGTTGSVQALAAGGSVGPAAQDLVPVYRTAALTRDQVKAVNKVAGELTTADLASMAAKAAGGANRSDLAATWLAEHGL